MAVKRDKQSFLEKLYVCQFLKLLKKLANEFKFVPKIKFSQCLADNLVILRRKNELILFLSD